MRYQVKYVLYNGVLYHPNFFKRAEYCLKRAKHTCQHCGIKRGDEYTTKEGRIDKAVIQAAHVNHDPKNPRALSPQIRRAYAWQESWSDQKTQEHPEADRQRSAHI